MASLVIVTAALSVASPFTHVPTSSPSPMPQIASHSDDEHEVIILAEQDASPPPASALEASSKCTAEFGMCTKTQCCSNPGFGCYKRPDKEFAQCLRRRPDCKDDNEWLCPGWEQKCAQSFADCRQSLCCQQVGFGCMRRPHLYYAQCRPLPSQCNDGDSWLCPGWEKCASADGECTKSRCCTDASHGCYLNETLLEAGGGWHAFCQLPPVKPNITSLDANASRATLLNGGQLDPWGLSKLHDQLAKLSSHQILHQFKQAEKSGTDASNSTTPWLCERASEWLCALAGVLGD